MLEVEGPVIPPRSCGAGMSKRLKTEAAAVAAATDRDMPESVKDGEKKSKKKLVEGKLPEDQVQLILSHPNKYRNRPFPVVTEGQLAMIPDPVEREEFRALMARYGQLFYQSRAEIKREQDLIRHEIDTLGYAKGMVEVTDDEEAGDN